MHANVEKKRINRRRKFRLSKKLSKKLRQELDKWGLRSEDGLDVMRSAMARLGVKSKLKSETRGRKPLPVRTRKLVWDFWHKKSSVSTNTSHPAKLCFDRRTNIDLEFAECVKAAVNKRRTKLYESPWMIVENTTRELHAEFQRESNICISRGK